MSKNYNDEKNELFPDNFGISSTQLGEFKKVAYCIDTSGSTVGALLKYEKNSAKIMSKIIKPKQVIGWNSRGKFICFEYLLYHNTNPNLFFFLI
jgi:hypothetical protein